ncbi:MarR family winged helix-turn-helix transcriptional regulator [Rhizobium wuzhouense]|uniref:MarR family transcriptional regulator n=1 Tax=Rhizobium wuzhouense TaxID=1986026 RepID=A0ABX5NNH8_9HYPH|nr:MarR family transcriptional regulator [Rhizobium wuzhouense]PYB71840.1 MarR family transcriptional regulator [Rhizobium wuzhouense]
MRTDNKINGQLNDAGSEGKVQRHVVETRLWLQILNVHRVIYTDLNTALADQFGLSVPKFDVLSHLYRYPEGLALGELSRKLRVSNGNVSGLIARLGKDGLLGKENAQTDRRSFRAYLTEHGRATFEAALAVHREVVSRAMASQSSAQIDMLTEGLRSLSTGSGRDKQSGDIADDIKD